MSHLKNIHSLDQGVGELSLVFLHGTGGDHNSFEPQLRYFSSKYRSLCPDLRGHGKSERPASGYEIRDFAEDIQQLIQTRDLQDVVLIGHSLGGMVALQAALADSTRIRGLVLIDVPILIPESVAQALSPLGEAFRSDAYPEVVSQFAGTYFFHPENSPANLKERMLQGLRDFPQDVFCQIWEANGRFDAVTALQAVKVPLLVIHATVPSDLNRFQALTPQMKLLGWNDVGHYVQLEVPERTCEAIDRFLEDEVLTGSRQLQRTASRDTIDSPL